MHAMVPTSSSGIPRRRLIWLIGLRERRNAEPRDRAEREAGDQLADGVREGARSDNMSEASARVTIGSPRSRARPPLTNPAHGNGGRRAVLEEVDRYLAARVAETEDQHAARPTVARRYIRSCADLPGERFQSGLARPVPLVGEARCDHQTARAGGGFPHAREEAAPVAPHRARRTCKHRPVDCAHSLPTFQPGTAEQGCATRRAGLGSGGLPSCLRRARKFP